MYKILDLYDRAHQDAEYMALHEQYAPAQAAFSDFWFNLPDAQQKIVDQYMFAAVSLYHRLLDMTFTQQEKRTGSD